jgi:hypothetical protein
MKRTSTIDRERDLILATLNQCGGSRSQVCKTLGIDRILLKKKLDQYAAQGFTVPPSPKGWIVREGRRLRDRNTQATTDVTSTSHFMMIFKRAGWDNTKSGTIHDDFRIV